MRKERNGGVEKDDKRSPDVCHTCASSTQGMETLLQTCTKKRREIKRWMQVEGGKRKGIKKKLICVMYMHQSLR